MPPFMVYAGLLYRELDLIHALNGKRVTIIGPVVSDIPVKPLVRVDPSPTDSATESALLVCHTRTARDGGAGRLVLG